MHPRISLIRRKARAVTEERLTEPRLIQHNESFEAQHNGVHALIL